MSRRSVVAALSLLLVTTFLAGCSGAVGSGSGSVKTGGTPLRRSAHLGRSQDPQPHIANRPSFRIFEQTVTFFDPTRDTPPRGSVPAKAGRILNTLILRPLGVRTALPLVVFAHGWDSNPYVYLRLLDKWASAGYMVAAPTFPDSTNTLPGTPVSDYIEEAWDISFVIKMLLMDRWGQVDPTRIAVAGQSDGGTDVALLALDPAFYNPHIRAYLALSGRIPPGVNLPIDPGAPGALLVVVGTADQAGLYPLATQLYQLADMNKALITVEGGRHLGIYIGTTPVAHAVRAETLKFLDATIGARRLPGSRRSLESTTPTDRSRCSKIAAISRSLAPGALPPLSLELGARTPLPAQCR
ncbi:MAG: hypothetical protein M1134_05995 [Actinobacteria bacterium]|nr:hypothetical protein [Actinomycetota bacterium]MCL5445368.1 hypothetical protein [Actinomycetota bacterium]